MQHNVSYYEIYKNISNLVLQCEINHNSQMETFFLLKSFLDYNIFE